MGAVVDTFDVAGRTTIRSGDGAFFHLLAEAEGGQSVTARVSEELLQHRRAGGRPRPGREEIEIVAPEEVASGLLRFLGDAGVAAAVVNGDTERASAGLVLHVARSPAERSRFDHLPGTGTAVLRCYREGDLVFVDPLSMSPQDPPGSQVLRRRLAASPAAAELKAWLDTPAASADIDLQDTALNLVAARLLTVITAWQGDSPALPAHRRTLWRVDSLTLAASEHPVLPFPEPARLVGGWLAPK